MKLTEKQRNEIISSCKLNQSKENIKTIADKYGITTRYIYKLIKSDISKQVEQNIQNNNQEFTKRADKIIQMIFDRLEKELVNNDKITLSQLSTTLGILYDKSRLEQNLSTSNNAIEINIKVEK